MTQTEIECRILIAGAAQTFYGCRRTGPGLYWYREWFDLCYKWHPVNHSAKIQKLLRDNA